MIFTSFSLFDLSELIICTVVFAYIFLILIYIRKWEILPNSRNIEIKCTIPVSLVIAVRNESTVLKNLIESIYLQSYSNLEVIFVNDHSEDNSLSILNDAPLKNFKVISLRDCSGKKAAISAGVEIATGDLIVCTDADCTFSSDWITSIVSFYVQYSANFISGPVKYETENTIFNHFQAIELMALSASGAASLSFNRPIMANGANIAFKKSAFLEVGGYGQIDHIASGDDILLMLKINKKFPNSCMFMKNITAVVSTQPSQTIKELYFQRKRWASKWKVYQDFYIQSTSLIVFAANLLLFLSFFVSIPMAVILMLLKTIVDGLLLERASSFYNIKIKWILFVCYQLIYPIYVLFFGIVGRMGSYKWKGRILK